MTGHVKFVETPEEEKFHEGEIKVEEPTETSVRCNIGFLQCFHKYRVSLQIPDASIQAPMAIIGLDVFGSTLENDKHSSTVNLILTIGNIKGTQETIVVFQKGPGQYNVLLHGNILGQEEGTPYLKSGVKMIEAMPATTLSDTST